MITQCHISFFKCQNSNFTVSQESQIFGCMVPTLVLTRLSAISVDWYYPETMAVLSVFHGFANLNCNNWQSTFKKRSFILWGNLLIFYNYPPMFSLEYPLSYLFSSENNLFHKMLLVISLYAPKDDKAMTVCGISYFQNF